MDTNITERAEAQASTHLFVEVPETTLRGSGIVVPAFQVSKYLASVGDEGEAYVSATDKPATHINFQTSRQACRNAGFELITNLQYLAMAQDISGVAENWTGGAVGEGKLFQGLRKWDVDEVQANDFEPKDPDERRYFVLSTGERIYDAAGHLFSWVVADIEGDPESGLINAPFAEGSPTIATSPYPSMEKGVGWYPPAGTDWTGSALVRGGYFVSGGDAGLFSLDFDWPANGNGYVGFRCTKPSQ